MKCVQGNFMKILFAYIFALLLSCSQEGGDSDNAKVYWVDTSRKVLGLVDKGSVDLAPYTLNYINKKGQRVAIESFKLNPDATFSYTLNNDMLLNIKDSLFSEAETIAAMGDSITPYPDFAEAIARLELAPKSFEKDQGTIFYTQYSMPFRKSDLMASQKTLENTTPYTLQEVAYQKVKIVSLTDNKPIPSASVIAVPNGHIKTENAVKKLIWMEALYRPILTQSDDNGEAMLYPLNIKGDAPSYSIIAYAHNYCTYVSEPLSLLKIETQKQPIISLRECPNKEKNALGFIAEIGPEANTYTIKIDTGEDAPVGYVNSHDFPIRIDSFSPNMAGLKIRFMEGLGPTGIENASVPVVNMSDGDRFPLKFQSRLSLNLPIFFNKTSSDSGAFTFEIKSLDPAVSTNKDLSAYIYGTRNSTAPAYAFAKTLVIKGKNEPNILSGLEGGIVTFNSDKCENEMEIGVRHEALEETVFFPCIKKVATGKVEDLKLDPDDKKIGGPKKIRVYIKDLFANVSGDDPARSNEISVFVDYGKPDLAISNLNIASEIGFTKSIEPAGTNQIKYYFPLGMEKYDGTGFDTLIITPTLITDGDLVFRFASPDTCKTKGTKEDGYLDKSESGIGIYKYRIAATVEKLPDATYIGCSDPSKAKALDWKVKTGDLAFPIVETQTLNFFLQVIDIAGHESLPQKYSIQPCPGEGSDLENISMCWK